jgi:sortase A
MIVGGVLTLSWAVLVWRWQDPFTAAYTTWKQHQLQGTYARIVAEYRPTVPPVKHGNLAAERRAIRREAAAFRRRAARGQAVGRIRIERIGLNMVLVNGTDHNSLKTGPGRDPRTFMPGENRLVYIAGHRTTYDAPFSHIDAMRTGDVVRLDMPYGTFVYRATRHRIVAATDLSVLRSPPYEELALQACHPRFFATQRYIVYAKLVRVEPRDGAAFTAEAASIAASPSS